MLVYYDDASLWNASKFMFLKCARSHFLSFIKCLWNVLNTKACKLKRKLNKLNVNAYSQILHESKKSQ